MSLRPYIPLTQHRGHVLISAPDVEPVTADSLSEYLREDVDSLPTAEADEYIAEARQLIEQVTGLAMITQSWRLSLDAWPGGQEPWWDGVRHIAISELAGSPAWVEMPRHPLQSVDSVTVFGLNGTGQTVDIGATFDIDTQSQPGRMVLRFGATWPIALRRSNAIQIEYSAGFGAVPASVPAMLRRAVKQVAAYLYTYRGDHCAPDDVFTASGAAGLLAGYRVRRL